MAMALSLTWSAYLIRRASRWAPSLSLNRHSTKCSCMRRVLALRVQFSMEVIRHDGAHALSSSWPGVLARGGPSGDPARRTGGADRVPDPGSPRSESRGPYLLLPRHGRIFRDIRRPLWPHELGGVPRSDGDHL